MKSPSLASALVFFFGPLGLLYSTPMLGVFLLFLHPLSALAIALVFESFMAGFWIWLLFWALEFYLAVQGVDDHNLKLKAFLATTKQ